MAAHRDGSPSDWIFLLAPDPAEPPPPPASSPQGLAEATERLGPGPVAWAVTTGRELARTMTREVPDFGGGPAPFETLRMGTEAATLHTLLLLTDPEPAADRRMPDESLLGDRDGGLLRGDLGVAPGQRPTGSREQHAGQAGLTGSWRYEARSPPVWTMWRPP
ncbi:MULTISPECIES: hypothetical protein [unclassified Streptomyces]|uniref:hypothetical protein n=1 Tax=unclassified Streptomyces TaxID=2593676 RepID=UPI0033B9848E